MVVGFENINSANLLSVEQGTLLSMTVAQKHSNKFIYKNVLLSLLSIVKGRLALKHFLKLFQAVADTPQISNRLRKIN